MEMRGDGVDADELHLVDGAGPAPLSEGGSDVGSEEIEDMVCDGSTMDRFEVMMAALEDFTMSEEFCDMQDAFCRDKCHVFKDSEENNLEYMAVFNAWVQTLEGVLDEALEARVPGWDMQEFTMALAERSEADPGVLESDAFELLSSMTDFEAFKDMMLSFKRGLEMEEAHSSVALEVTKIKVHTDEMSDGDERPDLDLSLDIKAI